MKTEKKIIKLVAISVVATFVLSACGGGGDGGSNTPSTGTGQPSTPTTPPTSPSSPSVPPQTSVPAPTYPSDSPSAALFAQLNAYRQALGVGLMKQDAALDKAANAHANYGLQNVPTRAINFLGHDENASLPGFTGAWPLQRAQAAGAPAAEWVGEVISGSYGPVVQTTGTDCGSTWINSVYHLQGMTANSESMGVGVATTVTTPPAGQQPAMWAFCVVDMGTTTGVPGAPDANQASQVNSIPTSGGQQFATDLVVHAPYSNETGVALAIAPGESPNPAPDLSAPGRPIMVRVNAANNDTLTVSNFQLVDSTGAVVQARILVPQSAVSGSSAAVTADPNNMLSPGVAFLLPLAALKPSTQYTVTFAGARDGKPMSTTWSFTTGTK
ncbi:MULTISPECIES: CAP domain-containing protein [Burkholderia cepacia complex]|uniref:CAP domain-containing protein n=1 Tax=Burkholderia cepacia TaxID=292 RepID=A0AAX2RBQ1_BURCE|nr:MULTISPECIES: CAP domain-containing protein [Burkholderia cepacia complex]TES96126.1 CAP domain-containing protein [Burkholderia cepacia]TEU31686.1 CAP domain-containing protein [Burkholderia cepacia]TEU32667.1 CAP domain-containing protein [Burkholderia cepacia]TEU90410.1 CAP domain-containing protein [Burkholderia cepacia]TEU99544.1 CAP domain-containing protein [Burkholderia cepacia]